MLSIMTDDNQNNNHRKIKILETAIRVMAISFIVISFFLQQLNLFFGLEISHAALNIFKYVLLGIGVMDLILLPVILKYADKSAK